MTELTPDDVTMLSECVADGLEPVAPAPEVRERVLAAVRGTPQELDETVPSAEESLTVRAGEGEWRVLPFPGVRMKKLSADVRRGTVTVLVELAAGSMLPAHDHRGPEDSFVVSGSCRIGAIALSQGDFHHVDGTAHHGDVVSDEGCVLLLVMDHADWAA